MIVNKEDIIGYYVKCKAVHGAPGDDVLICSDCYNELDVGDEDIVRVYIAGTTPSGKVAVCGKCQHIIEDYENS